MSFNASEAFNSELSLFSSLYQDMNAIDLPAGLSPANEDMWYIPGSVQTRPGLRKFLSPALTGNPTIMSVVDYPQASGDFVTTFLDSLGRLYQKDSASGAVTQMDRVPPGIQFKAENAFGKQWYAFFGEELAADFSPSSFVGVDIPRYNDGKGNTWRVTQDAPGQPPGAVESNVSQSIVAAPNGLISDPGVAVTSMSETGNLVTVLTPTASFGALQINAMRMGDVFQISAAGVAAYNGTWQIASILVGGTTTTITFVHPSSGLATTLAGTIKLPMVVVRPSADLDVSLGDLLNISGAGVAGYNGTWEIRAIIPGAPNRFIVYLPTFGLAASGSGTAAIGGLIAAGLRVGVLMFKSFAGAITAPSLPFFWTASGGLPVLLSQIPLGPEGTAQRILAFAPVAGENFYYIRPSLIPSNTGGPPLITQGTIIQNNTDLTAVLDFSDEALVAGTQIDIEGNDLFAQIVLAPCLGVIEYQQRLFWWGEINNLKNLLNTGFDGGILGSNPTGPALGWSNVYSTGGTAALTTLLSPDFGFAYSMNSAGGALDCAISQGAFQDYFGAPIFNAKTQYLWRFLALRSVLGTSGNLICEIFSPSGGVIATASIPVASLQVSLDEPRWEVVEFDAILPDEITQDALVRIYLQNVPAGATVVIDELEYIDAAQPVLAQQMRVSYAGNPFGYDVVTGRIGIDSTQSIVGAFKQRGYLYPLGDQSQFLTQNNGSTEPDQWTITEFAQQCGCSSPCAVDVGEGIALWAGQFGLRLFTGDSPKKLSQELQPTWDRINWDVETRLWLVNDPVERIIYIGMPLDDADASSIVQPVSYRSVDTAYNVPDPLFTIRGKTAAGDLCRKSTIWNVKANCGAMVNQPLLSGEGIALQMIFGGGNGEAPGAAPGFGNLYRLDFDLKTDDDYGRIGLGTGNFYVTSSFWGEEVESGVPGVGSHRKIFTFMSAFITGTGNLLITPYVDNLANPVRPLRRYGLLSDGELDHDLEWGMNFTGERMFLKIQPVPLQVATITNVKIEDDILTLRANVALGPTNYSPGQQYTLAGLTTATFLNGQTITIKSVSALGLTAEFTHADYLSAPDTGTSTPSSTTDAAMNINHMVVAGRMDKVFPVRGAYL